MTTPRITILGSSGFVGRHLADRLKANPGIRLSCPARDQWPCEEDLGLVYYCCGLTGDFLADVPNLIDAHVAGLSRLLTQNSATKVIYLSTTRIYGPLRHESPPAHEGVPISIQPGTLDHIYNTSKLMGELTLQALCERAGTPWAVLRLSNVVGFDPGSPNSLWQLIRQAARDSRLTFLAGPDSGKDYVALDDVLDVLVETARPTVNGIINVASGLNSTHRDLARVLESVTGLAANFSDPRSIALNHPIDTSRVEAVLGRRLSTGLNQLPNLWRRYLDYQTLPS